MSNLNRAAASATDYDVVVREAVERARRSSFYESHLAGRQVNGVADLANLPLTFKTHLRDASPYGMLVVPPAKAWHYHESSGTTGEPISTWCGVTEMRAMAEMMLEMVPEFRDDTILLNRFPLFAPVAFIFEEAMRISGSCHLAAGNMTWDVPFDRALDFIRRLDVTALSCLPLEPILLREVAIEKGLDLKRDVNSLKVIVCGGAVLPPSLRKVIESDWGARVVEIYGSNETMGLGFSCTEGRLHLCTNMLHVEILDPQTFEPLPAGTPGVLTITSLIHDVMPLVRYVTGDLVRVDPEPCPCGIARPTAQVYGRVDDTIEMGGAKVTHFELLDVAHDIADQLGTRIFFVVVRPRVVHFLVELDDPSRITNQELERRLRERLRVPVVAEVLGRNQVLDRSAIFRTPKIYKPGLITDWRKQPRKSITIMEALLEWPQFDMKTLLGIAGREIRNRRRRSRMIKEDRGR